MECNLGIVSACGPLMGPILQIIFCGSIATSIRTHFTRYDRTHSLSGSIPKGIHLRAEKSLPPLPDEEESVNGTYSHGNGEDEEVGGRTEYGYKARHEPGVTKEQYPY